MGIKLSAVQAALLIGRSERRVRDWIARQRLPAIKVGQAWQIDAEDLERVPGIKIDREQLALLQNEQASTIQGLLSRIAHLEHIIQTLHGEVAVLNARLARIERMQLAGSGTDTARGLATSPSDHLPDLQHDSSLYDSGLTQHEHMELVPPGSMRMKQFALAHKVPAAVLVYQIETGKIEDTSVSTANGRKTHWLTAKQQREAVAFWQKNGTRFMPCPFCPHDDNTN